MADQTKAPTPREAIAAAVAAGEAWAQSLHQTTLDVIERHEGFRPETRGIARALLGLKALLASGAVEANTSINDAIQRAEAAEEERDTARRERIAALERAQSAESDLDAARSLRWGVEWGREGYRAVGVAFRFESDARRYAETASGCRVQVVDLGAPAKAAPPPSPALRKAAAEVVEARFGFGPFDDEKLTRTILALRAALAAEPAPSPAESFGAEVQAQTVTYTNHRGQTERRKIRPLRLWWGATEWHKEPQWIVEAFDEGKNAVRSFALAGFAAEPAPAEAPKADATTALCEGGCGQRLFVAVARKCYICEARDKASLSERQRLIYEGMIRFAAAEMSRRPAETAPATPEELARDARALLDAAGKEAAL